MQFIDIPEGSIADNRKLIVLDIDETLLFASTTKLDLTLDYRASRTFVYKRPYVDEFLSYCLENFRVAVWTMASKRFADEIFRYVLPISRQLLFLWSAKQCSDPSEFGILSDYKIKNLSKIGDYNIDLKNVVMVDDTAEKLCLNQQNLIHIKPFFGDPEDCELFHLIEYLDGIKLAKEIGYLNKRNWRFELGNNEMSVAQNLVLG